MSLNSLTARRSALAHPNEHFMSEQTCLLLNSHVSVCGEMQTMALQVKLLYTKEPMSWTTLTCISISFIQHPLVVEGVAFIPSNQGRGQPSIFVLHTHGKLRIKKSTPSVDINTTMGCFRWDHVRCVSQDYIRKAADLSGNSNVRLSSF